MGLSGEVLNEEFAGQLRNSYKYSPWSKRLSQVMFNADADPVLALIRAVERAIKSRPCGAV
ncbi:hypothetical protein [Phytoactinopolyspora endophytica]|uniref:hypothetical protein n=1 Tax=Phytoactinopolyspora endophytica TaxID=1642495 RepID=UPI00101D8D3D|nr:hypothetical protein [Phytoactinopolyspora endophytica]